MVEYIYIEYIIFSNSRSLTYKTLPVPFYEVMQSLEEQRSAFIREDIFLFPGPVLMLWNKNNNNDIIIHIIIQTEERLFTFQSQDRISKDGGFQNWNPTKPSMNNIELFFLYVFLCHNN